MHKQHWQLGQLIFDPQRRTLQLAGQHCYLEPKQAQLLLLLAQNAGEPISREQLITEIWLGRVVSDSAINRAVSLLRKACARLDPATEYIATLPKLGYCLLPAATLMTTATEPDAVAISESDSTSDSAEIAVPTPPAQVAVFASRRTRLVWPLILLGITVIVASGFWLQSAKHIADEPDKVLIPSPLTSFDGAEFNISSSQDGQLLYHRRDAKGSIQLWLRNEQQDKAIVTVPGHAMNGSISPDGRQLVYRWLTDQQCQIMLLPLNPAGPEQVLFDCPPDSVFQAGWSPDSQHFYYRLRQSKTQPYLVYRYQVATANQQQLTLAEPDSDTGAIALAVAADGQQLAVAHYLTHDTSRLSLYRLTADQQLQLLQSADLASGIVDLSWPENQPLLVASSNQLYLLTEDLQLQHYFYSQQQINSVTSSKNQLYFADQQQQANIWRQPLGVGAAGTADQATAPAADQKPLIVSSRLDILPRINQQDTELLFLSTRQGMHQIWRKPFNGAEHLLAALPTPASFTRLSWSFDQRSVYFSQQGAVYQLELANSQLTQLFKADHQAFVVNPGPDGNSVIYSSNKTGDWQLWRYQLQSKQHQQLTLQGGYSGYVQGNTLYFSKFHQDGLWQLDLTNNEEQLLLADFDKINWLNWQLQDKAIVYFKPGHGIYRQSLLNNVPPELLLADSPQLVHHYSVSNQAIYFVKRLPPQGDIYQLPLP